MGQTVGVTTTYYALDVQGLPEVIYTSEGNLYLHLPGVIMAENGSGEVRYLLGDGLGSVRQAVDDTGAVVAYHEYDPYGNPVDDSLFADSPFAYTGEWWENEVGLLHLRARWYQPETGTFLSKDPVEGEPPYLYVRGNPVLYTDPSGRCPLCLLILLLLSGCGINQSISQPQLELSVQLVILDGSNVTNPDAYIKDANSVFAQASIMVKQGTAPTYLNEEETRNILGIIGGKDDKILDDFVWDQTNQTNIFNPLAANISEVSALFAVNPSAGGQPVIYFVPGLRSISTGRAYSAAEGGPAVIYSTNSAESYSAFGYKEDRRTFSHEIAHLLGLDHVSEANNLMKQGANTGENILEKWQIDIIRKSPYVK